MPCDNTARTIQEKQERIDSLKELETLISTGRVSVIRNRQGQVEIVNWSATRAAQAGWCDGCALAGLAVNGNQIVKTKLAALGVKVGGSAWVSASHASHTHKALAGGGHGHKH